MEHYKDLDIDKLVSDSDAEKYREDYLTCLSIFECYEVLSIKEYVYCIQKDISICKFISERHGTSVCKSCDEGWEFNMFETSITNVAFIITFIVALIMLILNIIN